MDTDTGKVFVRGLKEKEPPSIKFLHPECHFCKCAIDKCKDILFFDPITHKSQWNCIKCDKIHMKSYITGVFWNPITPGSPVDFIYRKNKEAEVVTYKLENGKLYRLPERVVELIRENYIFQEQKEN